MIPSPTCTLKNTHCISCNLRKMKGPPMSGEEALELSDASGFGVPVPLFLKCESQIA